MDYYTLTHKYPSPLKSTGYTYIQDFDYYNLWITNSLHSWTVSLWSQDVIMPEYYNVLRSKITNIKSIQKNMKFIK